MRRNLKRRKRAAWRREVRQAALPFVPGPAWDEDEDWEAIIQTAEALSEVEDRCECCELTYKRGTQDEVLMCWDWGWCLHCRRYNTQDIEPPHHVMAAIIAASERKKHASRTLSSDH